MAGAAKAPVASVALIWPRNMRRLGWRIFGVVDQICFAWDVVALTYVGPQSKTKNCPQIGHFGRWIPCYRVFGL